MTRRHNRNALGRLLADDARAQRGARARKDGETQAEDTTQNPQPETTQNENLIGDKMQTQDEVIEPQARAVATIEAPSAAAFDAGLLDRLGDMTPTVSARSRYLTFDTPGQTVRALLIGFDTMPAQGTGEIVRAAAFVMRDDDGIARRYIHAGASIIQQCERLYTGSPVPVSVTFTGVERTKRGHNLKAFDVVLLADGAPVADAEAVPNA